VPRAPYTAGQLISSGPVRKLLALRYLAGALVIADQLADLVASLLAKGPSPTLASWRFGTFGLLISRSSVFLIADVMFFTAAIVLGHRRVIRVLGAIHLLGAVLLLAGLVEFGLDWAEVRFQVPEAGLRNFQYSTLRAAALGLVAAAISLWTGIVALTATRLHGRHKQGDATPLLAKIRRDEESE
jgi:hypothetical protein